MRTSIPRTRSRSVPEVRLAATPPWGRGHTSAWRAMNSATTDVSEHQYVASCDGTQDGAHPGASRSHGSKPRDTTVRPQAAIARGYATPAQSLPAMPLHLLGP